MSQVQGWSDATQVWVSPSTTAAFFTFAQSFQRAILLMTEHLPQAKHRYLKTGWMSQVPRAVSRRDSSGQSFVSWLYLTHVGCVFCDSAAKVNCPSIGQCLRLVRDMNSAGGEARVLGLISWDCPRVLSTVAGDEGGILISK